VTRAVEERKGRLIVLRIVKAHRALAWPLLLAACSYRAAPAPLPPAPAAPGGKALHVRLLWSTPVDLDLYLTDPTAETVYFANNPTRTGLALKRDVRCRSIEQETRPSEHAVHDEPLAGRYRVGVDFIDACESRQDEADFRVVVDFCGVRRERIGRARLEQFQPIVLEFDLREKPDGSMELATTPEANE
jgi:hypothetical protein